MTTPTPDPDLDPDLDQVCEAWSHWTRTRRRYGAPPLPPSILGRLQQRAARRPPTSRTPCGHREADPACSAQLLAFHLAFLGQPQDAIDARVFRLHYEYRVGNVKAAAAAIGISRQHWYRLLESFRDRVWATSQQILADNQAAGAELLARHNA